MAGNDERVAYLEQKVKILNRLAEISAVLNSTLDLDPLLGYVMDAAAEVTASEAASVLLWDERTRELRFTATTTSQVDLNLIGQSVPLEGSLAGTALLTNQIVQVDDTASDPRHYSKVGDDIQFQTHSLLVMPMTSREKVIGVLEVINKRGLPWTEDDRDHLGVLTAQAAVAIEAAQMVAALQKANQELNELDKLKNDFIAIASHELRTPLAVILGYAGFLQDEAEGKASEHAAKVIASGLQLRRIIEDLTNLRYLQQSPSELARQTIDLREVVEDAIQDALKVAETKAHSLKLDLPEGETILWVDRIRASMALTNVLNNAVRFTPEGGQITVRGEVKNGDEVRVMVTDSGIGFAAEHADRLFEKFYQVEDHMTRTYGGMGIGLSIAKALVEAHGGRIWAESPGPNQGSTFTMTFPLAELSDK